MSPPTKVVKQDKVVDSNISFSDPNAENRILRDVVGARLAEAREFQEKTYAELLKERNTVVEDMKAKSQQAADDAMQSAIQLQAMYFQQQAREQLQKARQVNQRDADVAKAAALACETVPNDLKSNKEEVDRLKDVVDALSNEILRLNNEIKLSTCKTRGLEEHLRSTEKEFERSKQAALNKLNKAGMGSQCEATQDTAEITDTRKGQQDDIGKMEMGLLDLLRASEHRGCPEKEQHILLTSIQAAQQWAASVLLGPEQDAGTQDHRGWNLAKEKHMLSSIQSRQQWAGSGPYQWPKDAGTRQQSTALQMTIPGVMGGGAAAAAAIVFCSSIIAAKYYWRK